MYTVGSNLCSLLASHYEYKISISSIDDILGRPELWTKFDPPKWFLDGELHIVLKPSNVNIWYHSTLSIIEQKYI